MDSIVGSKSSEPRSSFEGDEASESGRQLRPVLEPVKERKSEYGFDGFDVSQANKEANSQKLSTEDRPTTSESDQTDIDELRRQSTSPKLPDVARLSGFGMDMFSQPKAETATNPAIENTARRLDTTEIQTTEDVSLRNQPSLGFRSVVNQAFERKDDSSVPPTPSSRGIGRTDSESTGTDGISPIMSRVPSSAVPKNRDIGTPSILEVVNEPHSPESHTQLQDDGVQLSNSADVNVGQPSFHAVGHKSTDPDATPEPLNKGDNEEHQLLRPGTDREQSFRPTIPGGWTSYATTTRSESPSKSHDASTHAAAPELDQNLDKSAEEDNNLTPTNPQAFPRGVTEAPADSTVLPAPDLGKHDERSPTVVPLTQDSELTTNRSSLPTPDQSMAPSGNVYSSAALDPRYFPDREQGPVESHLRPDLSDRAISTESSTAPTPPPKDTPTIDSPAHDAEYFPKPTVPLKPKSPSHTENDQFLSTSVRPSVVPTLSTDTKLHDDENDKLRKEIVKSLSPGIPESSQTEENMLLDEVEEGNTGNQYRESTYLPSEYDNYWATTGDDIETIPAVATVTGPAQEPIPHVQPESPTVAPLSPRREDNTRLQPARPSVSHRFSWEKSTESVPLAQVEEPKYRRSVHDLQPNLLGAPGNDPQKLEEGHPAEFDAPQGSILATDKEPGHVEQPSFTEPASNDGHTGRDVALVAGGAAIAGVAAASYAGHTPTGTEHRLSLAEEKDPQVSSYPVTPSPDENEHPARSPQPYFSPSAEDPSPHPPLSAVSPVTSSIQQQYSPSSRPLAFKQIAAINSQQERIQTYDQTRKHYASMNSGLNDWIVALQIQYPEHANITPSFAGGRMSVPSGSARSKFAKVTGVGAPAQEQPYYQQYLNASPTTQSIPAAARPGSGPSVPASSQSAFGSSGTKLTSHQVQAKGKEFLHTAGIFGGKAGKAGKGLLAKGKNKLRGAGGGDKTSPSPPARPKTERRSSWGFPLNLSRSSGRPEGSPHSLRYKSHPHEPNSQRPRAATLTSLADPAPQIPPLIRTGSPGDSSGVVSGVLHPEHVEPQQHDRLSTPPRREILSDEALSDSRSPSMAENKDAVGIPVPISKEQPSWDPLNSLPISEEGYQVDNFTARPLYPEYESEDNQRSPPIPITTSINTDPLARYVPF
jgi:hypothetical protein